MKPDHINNSQWYVAKQGNSHGPFDYDYISQEIAKGNITAHTMVWRPDFTAWQKAADTELAPLLQTAPNANTQKPGSGFSATEQDEQWYVMKNGQRLGPLSQVRALEAIEGPNTMVWKPGQPDWQRAGASALAPLLAISEPAYGPVDNKLVWLSAFSPLIGVVLAALILYAQMDAAQIAALQNGQIPARYTWVIFIPLLLQSGLGILDLLNLKRAGYAITSMVIAMLLLFPLYLFIRARTLKDSYAYAIVYLIAIAILLFA